ncbi:DUF4145 domain-containing protein [Devosia salina]|uniref:DUF4145 domain-containing protein n=1 Tax=Devosia salina TaxID=2860336 RepID=A0ABX8WD64_9HYPH|nr:DUF4145 domain-containing protein [Devosia salina]QYO75377.1 DUF4145 domain-containing protein [Devosia salina]
MTVNRNLWRRNFSDRSVPRYPCPRCGRGSLVWDEDRYVKLEPKHSERKHDNEDWEPDWVQYRFVGFSKCNNSTCGEIVAIAGLGYVDREYVYGDGVGLDEYEWQTMVSPTSISPAPNLFPLSPKIPEQIRGEIKLAFKVYWGDVRAATIRLRTSLEMVLDDRGVPRTTDKTDKKGKGMLPLEQRIAKFAESAGDDESAEAMHALRVVGNIGTHGETVRDEDFFDILDVYEHALLEIYEQPSAQRKAMRARLIALKDK